MTRITLPMPLRRLLPRLAALAALMLLPGCVAYTDEYGGGPGYAYAPAPVVVAPVFRAPYYAPPVVVRGGYGYGYGYGYRHGWR